MGRTSEGEQCVLEEERGHVVGRSCNEVESNEQATQTGVFFFPRIAAVPFDRTIIPNFRKAWMN